MGLQFDELNKVTEAKERIAAAGPEDLLARYEVDEARGKSDAMHGRLLQAQSAAADQNLLPCGSEARDMDTLLKGIDMPKAAHQVEAPYRFSECHVLHQGKRRDGTGILIARSCVQIVSICYEKATCQGQLCRAQHCCSQPCNL